MLGLRRWYELPEVKPHGGGDMIAQHAAEGGVLGKVGKRFESPGDDRGSHTDSVGLKDLRVATTGNGGPSTTSSVNSNLLAVPHFIDYKGRVTPVEAYLRHLHEIRSSGEATDETSYYTPLKNLFRSEERRV